MNMLGQEKLLVDDPGALTLGQNQNAGSKEDLAQKALALTTNEFVQERIVPSLSGWGLKGHADCSTAVLQNTGTGRLTLRYAFGPDVLIAKMFSDHLGPQSFDTTVRLWNSGFNRESPHQVPEPIAFFPDVNLLLMRQAPGIPVAAALEPDRGDELAGYCRQAAQWLAKLHRSAFLFGKAETEAQSLKLFRLATRLVKAASLRPEQLDMLRDLLDSIGDRIYALSARRTLVQTHGRYHHDHVFVSHAATVVIDLDRCCPSDPGKDVAEFVSVLRNASFIRGLDMACVEKATDAFLREYLASVPEAAATVGGYWATAVFHDLLSGIKKCRAKGSRSWEERQQFYLNEINRALGMQP
jgi:Phosphotransferase enzyme family